MKKVILIIMSLTLTKKSLTKKMNFKIMKKLLLFISITLLTTSCALSKKKLGLSEDIPDELQVNKVKALEVPPHFHYVSKKDINKQKSKMSEAEEAILKEAENNN